MGKKKKPAEENPGELTVGARVEVHGLQGAQDLNGQHGSIVKYVEETMRFGVRLDGETALKSVKPANLRRIGDPPAAEGPATPPAEDNEVLESRLSDVVQKVKKAKNPEERAALQKELQDVVGRLKQSPAAAANLGSQQQPAEAPTQAKARPKAPPAATAPSSTSPAATPAVATPTTPAAAAAPAAGATSTTTAATATTAPAAATEPAAAPAAAAPAAPPPPAAPAISAPILGQTRQPGAQPQLLQQQRQPLLQSQLHQPTPSPAQPGRRDGMAQQQPQQQPIHMTPEFHRRVQEVFGSRPIPVDVPPPPKPLWPVASISSSPPKEPAAYSDEHEYPDPARAHWFAKVAAGAAVLGMLISQVDIISSIWFVWSFLLVHLVGVAFLTDYAGDGVLAALWGIFGLHAGVGVSEMLLWIVGWDGEDSVGPWSAVAFFGCILYMQNFWMECVTLPPDYITSISFFFPMFPAYNAAVALSCLELFLEWRYFPEYKIWPSLVACGVVMMSVGQGLLIYSCKIAERNFWASCRNMPEEEEKPEEFVGLEIPDRRIVQEGPYRWERHPAYLGAMLWGVGVEVALCNPIMLSIVGFVLWASLLYVTLEEEQDLYEEFKGDYAIYSSLTTSWIPMFDSFLENAAFQREVQENCEAENALDEEADEEQEEEIGEEDEIHSEDDLLPTWEGVPKGGTLWNRQFRDAWLLG